MEIEKQRGISVTSSAMQFEYNGFCINILDTPGHQDFSEDTYRTLVAADAAVMLIDGAKGVKRRPSSCLRSVANAASRFYLHQQNGSAIKTLDLMDELEKVLGIGSVPLIGRSAPMVILRAFSTEHNRIELFDGSKGDHGASMVKVKVASTEDPKLSELIGQDYQERLMAEIELLDITGDELDMERVAAGELTVFSAVVTNFGVEAFLNEFCLAPPPVARQSTRTVQPDENFSAALSFKFRPT